VSAQREAGRCRCSRRGNRSSPTRTESRARAPAPEADARPRVGIDLQVAHVAGLAGVQRHLAGLPDGLGSGELALCLVDGARRDALEQARDFGPGFLAGVACDGMQAYAKAQAALVRGRLRSHGANALAQHGRRLAPGDRQRCSTALPPVTTLRSRRPPVKRCSDAAVWAATAGKTKTRLPPVTMARLPSSCRSGGTYHTPTPDGAVAPLVPQ
jgi:hypothetical protein